MKKVVLFMALALFFSCKNNKLPFKSAQMKSQTILLEFNQLDYQPFGVLTKKLKPLPQLIELGKDTFFLKNDSLQLYCIKNKLNRIKFEYQEDGYRSIGEFIIPNFYHIHTNVIFNVETYFTETIQLEPFFKPVRNGEWIIEENGKSKKINYNIVIDESELKKRG